MLRRGAVATTGVDTAGRGTTAGRVVTPGYGSGAGAEAPGLGSGPAVAGEEEAARAGVADPSARTRLAAAKGRSNDEAFIGLSDLPFAANAAWTLRGTQVLRTPRSSRHEPDPVCRAGAPCCGTTGPPANLQAQISICCPGWRILATFEASPSLVASFDWFVRPPPP